jgi:hypothetical protein
MKSCCDGCEWLEGECCFRPDADCELIDVVPRMPTEEEIDEWMTEVYI